MSRHSMIYVVDDDAAILHSIRFLLEGEGHCVEIFANGPQLLAAMSGDCPSCVLLDYVMPEMDGLEVLNRLRNFDVHVPVVMMTGHPDLRIRVAASGAGVPLIEKPLAFEVLRTMLAVTAT